VGNHEPVSQGQRQAPLPSFAHKKEGDPQTNNRTTGNRIGFPDRKIMKLPAQLLFFLHHTVTWCSVLIVMNTKPASAESMN
jgi:hypothetical protein